MSGEVESQRSMVNSQQSMGNDEIIHYELSIMLKAHSSFLKAFLFKV